MHLPIINDRDVVFPIMKEIFPKFKGEPTYISSGWDFDIWQFGKFAFKFPRRLVAEKIAIKEMKILPFLASSFNINIPNPIISYYSYNSYKKPFLVYNFINGISAEDFYFNNFHFSKLSLQLGGFLKKLHSVEYKYADRIGAKLDIGRGCVLYNKKRAYDSISSIDNMFNRVELKRIVDKLESFHPCSSNIKYKLIHGDLYSRHIILDKRGSLKGIIDWGGVCLGDPALDLSIVYTFFPKEYRKAFWNVYGSVKKETKMRAKYLGFCRYGVRALAYSRFIKNKDYEEKAIEIINNY